MRPLAAVLLAMAALPDVSGAQLPDLPTFPNWVDFSYPKLYYGSREGLTVGLYYAQVRQLGYSDWYSPPPFRASVSLDAQFSTSGSKRVGVEAWLPQMADGWRFFAAVQAERRARQGYFGIGNDTPGEDNNITDLQSHFYQSDNRRLFFRGEIQRRLVGPVRILGGLHVERWRVDTLSGGSLLAADAAAGADPTISRNQADVSARVGLVVDWRDDEVAPRRGILLSAIYGAADSSVFGDLSYTRATLSAAGYVPLGERIVLAARVLGQTMSGSPHLGSFYVIEETERPTYGLGGAGSHRALDDSRLLGPDKLLTNFDARIDLFTIPTLARVTLLGFVDAARVFDLGELELTTDNLKVGGGGGLMLQIGRAGILGGSVGTGPDGVVTQFYSAWTY